MNSSSEPNRRIRPSGYPRRRAVAACSTCRERKRKCDNRRPICSACQQIGAQCDYAKQDASTFDPASLEIIERLSEITDLLKRIQPSPALSIPGLLAGFGDQAQPQFFNSRGDNASNTNIPGAALALDANFMISTDKLLQWPAFEERLATLPRVEFTGFRGSQCCTYLDDLYFRSDESMPPSLQGDISSSLITPSISTERSEIEPLVDDFLKKVNNKNPIISPREAARLCDSYYENGPQFDLQTCLVLLTCALGAVSMDFHPPDADEHLENSVASATRLARLRLGHCYFVAAQKRLGAAVSHVDTSSIQCLCLAGVYYMYTIRPICALRMFNSAGSLLQISTSTRLDSSLRDANIYSSLFSMCYKSERCGPLCYAFSFGLFLPVPSDLSREILAEIPISTPALRESSFPQSYPPPPQAQGLESDPWDSYEEDSWYFFLSEIALRRITNQVAEAVSTYLDHGALGTSTMNIEALVSIVGELERQVETFRDQLPPAIQFPDVPQAADTEWKQYTRGRYYRVLELMHRPFLYQAISATDCSPLIRGLAEKALANALRYLQHSHASHRHHGLWLQLRNMLKAACLLLVSSGSSRLGMPSGWEAGVSKALGVFEYWSLEYPPCRTYSNIICALAEFSPINLQGAD